MAGNHYNKTLARWRTNKGVPQGVKEDIWTSWNKMWESEEWKCKSKQAIKNRRSELGGPGTGMSKYTGGSRSILENTKIMVKLSYI